MLARLGLHALTLMFLLGTVRAADIRLLIQQAKPAIVEILTYDQQNKLLKTGTGFFVSPDGAVLTNFHVISGGSSVKAKTPTGALYFLKSIVAESESDDVAKLQFLAANVSYLTLGSSLKATEGERVLVIGNPKGLEGTVSDGIISAFRSGRKLIQITAPISPGSSGSPVLDESGHVIGMATQVIKEGQNLNFAISAEAIRDTISRSASVVSTPSKSLAPQYSMAAYKKLESKDWLGAIADFTEEIRVQPNSIAYFFRGYAYQNLEQYENALDDYTNAILLSADAAMPYLLRGIVFYELKQYEKAASDYTEAIRLTPSSPNSADLYLYRANAYDRLGKLSLAEQDRKKAKEIRGY